MAGRSQRGDYNGPHPLVRREVSVFEWYLSRGGLTRVARRCGSCSMARLRGLRTSSGWLALAPYVTSLTAVVPGRLR